MSVELGRLDDAEAFEGEHLTEAAFVLLADGAMDLLSERARGHAESCAACAGCIAEQALAAAELHQAFTGLPRGERARLVEREELVRAAARATGSVPAAGRTAHLLSEPKVAEATFIPAEPSSSGRRARGGGLWIAAGLLVAGLSSVPSLSGLAKGISELRHALLVVVSVSVQAEQALRIASGRMEIVRTTASWTAAFALVGVGLWIARREPKHALVDETKDLEGAR